MSHLGGHCGVTNIDPPVLDYLIARYRLGSLLDVGCGPGGMLDLGIDRGLRVVGVDGDPSLERPDVILHDYTTGPLILPPSNDLVWCVEFVEHVEEAYIPNYFATFRAGRVLMLSHALPGQPGYHHVNCQAPAYWAALLQADGWSEDTEASAWIAANAFNRYVRQTGRVWTR